MSPTGVRLQPCQSGVVEVFYSDSFNLTCDQYSGTVTWYVTYERQYTIGTCSTSSCQIDGSGSPGYFTLTFLTPTSSRLILHWTYTGLPYRHTYTCRGSDQDDCTVDFVSHAIVPASGLTFTSTRWYVQGSSDVTSVFSSMGRYSCSWTETRDSNPVCIEFDSVSCALTQTVNVSAIPNVTLTLTPDPSDVSNIQDRRGTCSFSKRLPTDDGNYTYTVVVSPGNTERTAGSVEIVRPVMPRVSCCPSPYVPGQNTSVVCTCNTQSVGRPEGRLRWFRGSGNNNPINSGNYGDTNLIMTPQMVTFADFDVTTFRCDVDWIETVSGESYTARMGPEVEESTAEVEKSTAEVEKSSGLTVILAVTAALLLLLLVTIIVFCCWLWRRGWVMPCADMGRQASAPPKPLETDADDNLPPTALREPDTGLSGPYESLQMDDVGLRSPYAEISCRGNH
ncbi:hypothetical protein BaRGS_00031217 [Batillaria attramentaria]|uniref:Ig-like domain-containing protein n=1 Tax=Batillaria attramentaria TaxID=370345 RepID=A0ABD0JRH0_9CAEN